jgi:hypothetical protein
MLCRTSIAAIILATAACATPARAQIVDFGKYPDLKGQWVRVGPTGFNGTRFDPSKPPGRGQDAPLTPQYQAIFDSNLADQAAGGQGTTPTYACLSPGMPRATNGYNQIEFVVTPDTTYILVQHINDDRRIFTDGRDWPEKFEPTFMGYSIGKWLDTTGAGRYDTLEVETRNFKGPRTFDSSGIPLHPDGQTIVKERFYLDKSDSNVFHDQVTVIDHALTRPWTVLKTYRRDPSNKRPYWIEMTCAENNPHVIIGKEGYMLSADGFLMPAKKDQPPPDLRYFKQSQK